MENGRKVAEFLRNDPRVTWTNYAGFTDSPYHALAQKYLGGQGCSLLMLGIKGGYEAAIRFYDALKLVKRLVNIGDVRSLCCHSASTTHRQMTPDEQWRAHQGKPVVARPAAERVADEGAQHVERAVGEIHDPHQAEDQRQADAEEEQQGRLRQRVGELRQQKSERAQPPRPSP